MTKQQAAQPAKLHCHRCGYEWFQRGERPPGTCPKCKNPNWDRVYEEVDVSNLTPIEIKMVRKFVEARRRVDPRRFAAILRQIRTELLLAEKP